MLAACGDDDEPATDASSEDAAGGGRFDLGEGARGDFRAIENGDTLTLVRGCQGLQHVWIAMRAYELDTSPALVQVLLTRNRDGEAVSTPLQVRITFQDSEVADSELTGLALVVPDPALGLGEELTLNARLSETNAGGAIVTETRSVRLQWGTEVCGMQTDAGPDAGDAGTDARMDARPDADASDARDGNSDARDGSDGSDADAPGS